MAEFATRWLAVERYQSIDDTIVQLFISPASVLMTRVDRIHEESRPGSCFDRRRRCLVVGICYVGQYDVSVSSWPPRFRSAAKRRD
jgi:hypothetical protein